MVDSQKIHVSLWHEKNMLRLPVLFRDRYCQEKKCFTEDKEIHQAGHQSGTGFFGDQNQTENPVLVFRLG